jgi:hypothetical protein
MLATTKTVSKTPVEGCSKTYIAGFSTTRNLNNGKTTKAAVFSGSKVIPAKAKQCSYAVLLKS